MKNWKVVAACFPLVLWASACTDQKSPSAPAMPTGSTAGAPAAPTAAPLPGRFDAGQIARGADLYKQHCATCHGANAEGAPNWAQKGPDGKFPPPPLDASGHAWHHPKSALVQTIKQGTLKIGGSMPAWEGKLGDADIEAVIAWFQSRWPEDIYKNWAFMDEKARRGLVRH